MATIEQERKEIDGFNEIRERLLLSSPDTQALFAHFFNQGVKSGIEHSEPSKKTMEELTIIKVSQARHEEKLDSIKTNLEGHISKEEETFQRLEKIVADFMTKADEKYSPISAWKIIVWSGRIVGIAAIGGLLGLIAKAYIHLN